MRWCYIIYHIRLHWQRFFFSILSALLSVGFMSRLRRTLFSSSFPLRSFNSDDSGFFYDEFLSKLVGVSKTLKLWVYWVSYFFSSMFLFSPIRIINDERSDKALVQYMTCVRMYAHATYIHVELLAARRKAALIIAWNHRHTNSLFFLFFSLLCFAAYIHQPSFLT